ncbi:hypothetical protein BH11ACT5_BH11ACT5_11800 [soil metagenome]
MDSPGTRNEHITHVQYSESVYGTFTTAAKETVVGSIESGQTYRSHNDATLAEATVVTRIGPALRKYIATVADGTETNNLLALPRF